MPTKVLASYINPNKVDVSNSVTYLNWIPASE